MNHACFWLLHKLLAIKWDERSLQVVFCGVPGLQKQIVHIGQCHLGVSERVVQPLLQKAPAFHACWIQLLTHFRATVTENISLEKSFSITLLWQRILYSDHPEPHRFGSNFIIAPLCAEHRTCRPSNPHVLWDKRCMRWKYQKDYCSVIQIELTAIRMACEYLHHYSNKHIILWTASLKSVIHPISRGGR